MGPSTPPHCSQSVPQLLTSTPLVVGQFSSWTAWLAVSVIGYQNSLTEIGSDKIKKSPMKCEEDYETETLLFTLEGHFNTRGWNKRFRGMGN